MKLTRVPSLCLLAFVSTLTLVGCQRIPSKTAQSNQGSGSQAQSAPQLTTAQAQPADANTQAQPASTTAQSSSNSGQSAAGSGPTPSRPSAAPTQLAVPAPLGQDARATQVDQSSQPVRRNQPSQNAQTGTGDSAESQPPRETIPEGTPVEIRLTQSLSSARSISGQGFAASLDAPIVVGNAVVVPRGANVTGRVVYAKGSGRLKGPAELTVTLTSLEVDGQDYSIVTAHKSWRGKSHKKRNLAWIGGGGGGGSLVGLAAGGGVGAAIGAGVGAGGGTVAAFVTGRKNIVLPSESRLYFVLRRPVTVG